MKDLKKTGNLKGSWKISKTMKSLLDLKKWKVWNIWLKNIHKLDKEYEKVKKISDDFIKNKISKDILNSEMNLSERLISWIIHDSYLDKFGVKSNAELHMNRLFSSSNSKYEFAIWNHWEDARFEEFQNIDEVLDRMKNLVS